MTAVSPTQFDTTLVACTITSNGKPLDSAIQILSIETSAAADKLPRLRLVVADGNPETGDFPVSASSTLIPGAAIAVALGYETKTTEIFSGVIHRQSIEISAEGTPRLIAEASDKAMAMTLARNNAIFTDKTDSDLIAALFATHGISATVAGTGVQHPAIVQYYASDWDMMLMRAQLNGMVVLLSGGVAAVASPDTTQAPALALTYGESIRDLRLEMDAATQYSAGAIQSYAWDPSAQSVDQSGAGSAQAATPGNLSSETLASVFAVEQVAQQSSGQLEKDDLTVWSSSTLLRSRLAKVRGEVEFQGSALAVPGCMVTLAGLGARFNGNAWVSGVRHAFADGNWTTTVEIGLPPNTLAESGGNGIEAPAAAGQLPAIASVQPGVVRQTADDPEGEYRVLVDLPMLQSSSGVWARLGNFHASNGAGAVFYPEIGDEVAVAFMNSDPRYPVVLGSLYSKAKPPVVPPDLANSRKTIVTRSGLRLDFDETAQAVEVSTPAKQSVRLDDKAKTVTVADANGNRVQLSSSGIALDSGSDLQISAKGNISITAQGNLALKATANLSLDGLTIKANADTSFAAQGAAEAKLTSSGIVTVQGAMVKIN